MPSHPPRQGDSPFRVVLRRALPPAAAAGVLTAIILWILSGPAAGVAGLIGVVIALGFFASGLLLMARFVTENNPLLFMAVGMAIYFAQVIVLFGVLVLAWNLESFDTRSAGIAMGVTVIVWQVAQVMAWRQARVPIYDEPAAGAAPAEGESR